VLVERATELGVLAQVLNATKSGTGGLVLVVGPAGIGKTSLLAEAARLGCETGLRPCLSRGIELEQELAFGVVRQLLEPVLQEHPHRARLFAGAAAPAAPIVGQVTAPDSAIVGNFAVLHGLYWLVANLCRARPHLLVVDDLQWADRATLRYLTYLQPRLSELPLAIVAALRPHEPNTEHHLIDLLATDPAAMLLHPQALSASGTAEVVNDMLHTTADPRFLTACHAATAGNPLLLHQLAEAIADDGLPATADNAERVAQLVPRQLGALIGQRLAQLSPDCEALANAVAVLGDDVPLHHAATLAGLGPQRAAQAAGQLRQVQVLDETPTGFAGHATAPLRFVHPLVRAAVYDRIDPAARLRAHAAAVTQLIGDPTSDPERTAAHLLRVPLTGDPDTIATLRQAAKQASVRGAPDTALSYLQRALDEPMTQPARADLEEEAGRTAQAMDNATAATHLARAHELVTDPVRQACIAQLLGNLYLQMYRLDEAAATWRRGLAVLPQGHDDIARHMYAGLLNAAVIGVLDEETLELADRLGRLPFHDSLGGRALEATLGGIAMMRCEPGALEHARRAMADGMMLELIPGESPVPVAWFVQVYSDDPEAAESLDTGVAQAYRRGAVKDLTAALTSRAVDRLRRGDLAGAETDGRECARAVDASHGGTPRPLIGAYLAETLLEQGRHTEAQATLDWIGLPDPPPRTGMVAIVQLAQARLRHADGHPHEALATALAAGQRVLELGGDNPSWVSWRSEAALCLHELSRDAEARELMAEELSLARRWTHPLALGRALRVAGAVRRPADLDLLREAVSVLEPSTARLEHAKALVELGCALRRAGQRDEAKSLLARGLDLAHHCGAAPLAQHANAELRATGARPRRPHLTGAQALTPSELRVAELAATGHTNRDIAQQLFITVKTVEIHLANTYRKLGITRRHDLSSQLRTASPADR
jgi:DNA-binding CsgD family transcriptional regulator